jgi:hypothetical protein
MILCAMLRKHSDWFNGIDILQGRWQHGEKVGYCYPSGLEKTLFNWEIYVPLVTKGLTTIVCSPTIGLLVNNKLQSTLWVSALRY